MVNPDGVIHGNYRCSLAGCDLNRRWKKPHKVNKIIYTYIYINILPNLYINKYITRIFIYFAHAYILKNILHTYTYLYKYFTHSYIHKNILNKHTY